MFGINQTTNVDDLEHRDFSDLLRYRVKLLKGEDKLLMIMYLEKGNSFRQMARLAGVNETIIARRIHKIIRRLTDGEYITCLRNRNRFNSDELAIAKEYFLNGLSMREIAEKQHFTYYRVNRMLRQTRKVIKSIQQNDG